jgi:hypothetical protein
MKHMKNRHNGKDRRTGRKVRKNPNSGCLADPAAEETRKEWVAAKRATEEKHQAGKDKAASRGPCCKDAAAIKAKNEQLLSELRSLSMDRALKEERNQWVIIPVVPRNFIATNRRHMAHFRQYVESMNLPYKF